MPPYLAGRTEEVEEFRALLKQPILLQNVVLTGLRGVGKTVLLETFKPEATKGGWLWVGADLSESASVDESRLSLRLMTDLSVVTAAWPVAEVSEPPFGFSRTERRGTIHLDFEMLLSIYERTPGLASDKLKAVLEEVWTGMADNGKHGIVFAYDEAQNLADHAEDRQYPLALLLDVFQSIQKKGIRFMLVLTGLPTLFPRLVAARTYAERMFRVITLDRLSRADSREAIVRPMESSNWHCRPATVEKIIDFSSGYPYFIQFLCRELYDAWIQLASKGKEPRIPISEIQRKLDTDFFAGRWARVTDRQRELLIAVAHLPSAESEFTVQEIVEEAARRLPKPFSASHVSQMLNALSESGLVYRNRHGRYSLAVPLLNRFILRQLEAEKTG